MARKHTIVVGADITQAEREFKKLSRRVQRSAKELQDFGKSTMALTAPLVALGGIAVKTAMELEESFKIIRAGTGATGEALKGLKDDFRAVSRSVPEGFEAVATAVADLNTMLGISGDNLQGVAQSMLNLTRLSGGDLKQNIASITRAMNSWNISGSAGSQVANTLFVVSQATGASVADLARQLTLGVAPLQAFGMTFEQAAVTLGQFSKAGIVGKAAMSGLKQALAKMAQAGVKDMAGGFKSITEAIVKAGTVSEATKIAVQYFGAEAGGRLAQALRSGVLSIDDLAQALSQSGDELNKASKEGQTFGDRLKTSAKEVKLALEPLGQSLLDLGDKYLIPALRGLSGLDGKISDTAINCGILLTALGPATWAIGGLVKNAAALGHVIVGTGIGVAKLANSLALSGAATTFAKDMTAAGVAIKSTSQMAKDMSITMVAGAGAMGKLRMATTGLLTTLTGPAGLVLALGALASLLVHSVSQANRQAWEEMQRYNQALDEYRDTLQDLNDDQLTAMLEEQGKAADKTREKIAALNEQINVLTQRSALVGRGDRVGPELKLNSEKALLERELAESIDKSNTIIRQKRANEWSRQIQSIVKKAQRGNADDVKSSRQEFQSLLELLSKDAELKASLEDEISKAKIRFDAIDVSSTISSGGLPSLKPSKKERTRFDDIRDALKYGGADGSEFLPELKSIMDKGDYKQEAFQQAYDLTKQILDAQRSGADKARREADETFSWQHQQGFISNADYAQELKRRFDELHIALGTPVNAEWTDDLRRVFSELQRAMVDLSGTTMDQLKKQFDGNKISSDLYKNALSEIIQQYAEYPLVVEKAKQALEELNNEQKNNRDYTKELRENAQKWAQDLQSGIADAIVEGKNLTDVLKNIGKEMQKFALKWMLFGQGGDGGLLGGLFANIFKNADGNVFIGGQIQPFASGGVVSVPTFFGMSGRKTGVMGEAGPEAIMPLKRGPDGKLGISMPKGSSHNTSTPSISVTVNVSNNGSGEMSDEQANELGNQVKNIVKAQVYDTLYEAQRSGNQRR